MPRVNTPWFRNRNIWNPILVAAISAIGALIFQGLVYYHVSEVRLSQIEWELKSIKDDHAAVIEEIKRLEGATTAINRVLMERYYQDIPKHPSNFPLQTR